MKDLVPVANSIPEVVLNSQEKKDIKTILAVNLPILPTDISKLPDYINVGSKVRDYMKKIATRYVTQGLNPQIYNMALDRAIECGELVLRAELTLSTNLKQIKTRQGMRTDLKKVNEQHKTKTEEIKQKYGLTPEQAKKISMLEEWAVEAAIKQGWKNREIPTRTMALQMIKEKHKAENNKPYNPNAVYMDYVPYPEEVMALPPIRSTTLCSNVGIDEYFLEYAHVKNVIAAEYEKPRVQWYKEVYPSVKVFQGDLFDKDIQKQIIEEHIKQSCKLIIATPPCQTISLAGKRDFNDPRTKLFLPILNIIEGVDSINDYVLIENVPPYMTASPKGLQHILEGKTIAEHIKYRLEKLGYEVNIDKINGANYGTAQARERMILLASKKGMWKFPIPFKKQVTLMDAIGNLARLPEEARQTLQECIEETSVNTGTTVVLALSYSARWEITEAVRQIAEEVRKGDLVVGAIDEAMVSSYLTTRAFPDPDLLIRTGGEQRLSNFLLWQLSYAEFYFTDIYWPDFRKEEFYDAILYYQHRERRFGKTSEQLIL